MPGVRRPLRDPAARWFTLSPTCPDGGRHIRHADDIHRTDVIRYSHLGRKGSHGLSLDIFLIDYENVQPTGVGRLVPGACRIMVFLGRITGSGSLIWLGCAAGGAGLTPAKRAGFPA